VRFLRLLPIVVLALGWQFTAVSASTQNAGTGSAAGASPSDLPEGSTFDPPPENACESKYDRFYEEEPGAYAYWALCESGTPEQIHDYVGEFDLTKAARDFGTGQVTGGFPGPVPDDETAGGVPTATVAIINQGLPVNRIQGTIALWLYADAIPRNSAAVTFSAVHGTSSLAIGLVAGPGQLCVQGGYVNDQAVHFNVKKCGVTPDTWHRVVFTWKSGDLSLWIDGSQSGTGTYNGQLEDKVYYYRLFPGCCDTGSAMRLAKVVVANQAWTPAQIQADIAPVFPTIPAGGVEVTLDRLGTIHRDVLGFADSNQSLADPLSRGAFLKGVAAAGFTSVRYASGYGGITADFANWTGGPPCTNVRGAVGQPARDKSGNTFDEYEADVISKFGLDVVYTINYGTNPPDCNSGGDPTANAKSLVEYADRTKSYHIHRWEIGNELFSAATETDFHPDPNTGASYAQYEPAFYDAIKAIDPGSEVAVPIGLAIYGWQTNFDIPVLNSAKFDAVVWHNYPMIYPITDGNTLYQDRVDANIHRTHGELLKLETELLSHGKSPDAIWVTEWNNEVGGFRWTRQAAGAVTPLFTAVQLAEYMQAGVRIANWWTQGRPNVCSILNYDGRGETAYNWYKCGMAAPIYTGSIAGVSEVTTGLKPGDLLPSGRAFQLLSQSGFVSEGEHMLRTRLDPRATPWLLAYAATHDASCAVLLINRDRDQKHTIPIQMDGKASGKSVQQWTYGRTQYDLTRNGDWSAGPVHATLGAWSGAFQATLPPWSISVLLFH
jgi:hypothetical protein